MLGAQRVGDQNLSLVRHPGTGVPVRLPWLGFGVAGKGGRAQRRSLPAMLGTAMPPAPPAHSSMPPAHPQHPHGNPQHNRLCLYRVLPMQGNCLELAWDPRHAQQAEEASCLFQGVLLQANGGDTVTKTCEQRCVCCTDRIYPPSGRVHCLCVCSQHMKSAERRGCRPVQGSALPWCLERQLRMEIGAAFTRCFYQMLPSWRQSLPSEQ